MIGYDPKKPGKAAEAKGGGKAIYIPAPEGLGVEQRQPGDEFESVAKLRVEDDGKLCLKSLDGIPVGSGEAKPEKPDKATEQAELPAEQQTEAEAPEDFTAAVSRRTGGQNY